MLVFYLMILGLAFVVVAVPALWDRLHRRQLCFGDLLVAFVILSAVSGICARLFLYFAGDGIYSFMDFGAKQQRHILLPALAADILTYALIMLVRRAKEKRTALFERKKHGIVPFVSLRYCCLILAGLYWVLCLADSVMPQYGYWRTENNNINDYTFIHANSKAIYEEKGYPLLPDSDRVEEGDKVVLVIGDSFVWGNGSDNINKIWWRVLQQKLRNDGYEQCKVLAVGQNGASTQDELRWLANTSLLNDLKPDLIIIGYVSNDPAYRNEKGEEVPGSWLPEGVFDKGVLMYVSMLLPNVSDGIDGEIKTKKQEMFDYSDEGVYRRSDWMNVIVSGEFLETYHHMVLEPLGDCITASEIPAFVMTTPGSPTSDEDSFKARYKDVSRLFPESGIPFYNNLDDFVSLHGEDEAYFKKINLTNSHPSAATNAYFADYAYRVLREDYPEVLGEKSRPDTVDLKLNDWYPCEQLQPEVTGGDTVTFSYSDHFGLSQYLYLPMFKRTVKLCFAYPMAPIGFQITDSSGTVRTDFDLYLSHLGEGGYDVMEEKPVKADGDTYPCVFDDITSINIHRNSASEQEERYAIRLLFPDVNGE